MPSFEEYQDFASKMKNFSKAQRLQKFFFWVGVIAFWFMFCVGSAYAIRYLLSTLSFFPKNIEIPVLDILKIYAIFAFLWAVRKLFPLE